jgi:hypothetical protein
MPDRVIRDEILKSDTMLGLKRNTHRLAFLACVLEADDLGNIEAEPGALWRLWRDWLSLTDRGQVAEILLSLTDSGLVRLYEVDGKRYAHIPKFRQRLRYVKGKHPRPPEALECKEIKALLGKSPTTVGPKTVRGRTVDARSEEKRSEEKRREEPIGTVECVDRSTPSSENGNTPTTLPEGLSARTWDAWKLHLRIKGRALTPIAETYALVQLAKHPPAQREEVVANALARSHVTLAPVGGWPSEQSRPTQADKLSTVAAGIWGATSNERADDIDGTAERVG